MGAYRETPESMFVYIEYIESHPDSNPTLVSHRKYVDIGRMMIAFGIQLSIDSGKNGVVTFEAKTDELARHYISDFGAVRMQAIRHQLLSCDAGNAGSLGYDCTA